MYSPSCSNGVDVQRIAFMAVTSPICGGLRSLYIADEETDPSSNVPTPQDGDVASPAPL